LAKNPCSVIQKLPQDKRAKKTWTTEEFAALLRCLTTEERPFILTLAYTMARIDEILRLTVADINFPEKYLTLYTRKNKDGAYRPRKIPMGDQIVQILYPICHERSAGDYVFVNPKTKTRYTRRPKLMLGLCKRAGITHYGFHAIRHFVTSFLYSQKDVGKAELQRLLGHQTPTTTDLYIDSLDGNLRAPVEKLAGLLDDKPVAPSGGALAVFKANPDALSAKILL
jgi:integrase